jgi:hypothetical protein
MLAAPAALGAPVSLRDADPLGDEVELQPRRLAALPTKKLTRTSMFRRYAPKPAIDHHIERVFTRRVAKALTEAPRIELFRTRSCPALTL